MMYVNGTVPFRCRHLLSSGIALRGLDLSSISRRSQVPSATIHSVLLYSVSIMRNGKYKKTPIVDCLIQDKNYLHGSNRSTLL